MYGYSIIQLYTKENSICKDTVQYNHIRHKTNDDSILTILPLIYKHIQTCTSFQNNITILEMFQVQVRHFIPFCPNLAIYFDYIANFVDIILLYMYVFCFDIWKIFLKFLILTQLLQYKFRSLRRILRKQRTLFFSLVLQVVHLCMQIST